jgi:hypothetical protein
MTRTRLALVGLVLLVAGRLSAAPAAESVVGEITAIDLAARTLTLKSDAGATVRVTVAAAIPVLRAQPGATKLDDAAPAALENAAVGDRALVRGVTAEDGTVQARRLVLMSRQDIDQKHAADKEDWRKRGILGTVASVDTAAGRIVVRLGRRTGASEVNVETAGHPVSFRRYAADSVRFSDAKPSDLSAVRVGDELRAKGRRSEDGATLSAEEVVFGTFRMIAGAVTSVDAEHGRVVVRSEESRQPVTVDVGPDARLRRIPPEMATWLARRSQWQQQPGGNPQGQRPGGGQWQRPEGGSPEDMIERMPKVALADLKSGDRVMVSSTEGTDAGHATAIVLVTGLEALQAPAGPRRGGRGADLGLPAELMDLGMGMQ